MRETTVLMQNMCGSMLAQLVQLAQLRLMQLFIKGSIYHMHWRHCMDGENGNKREQRE